eukprot:TRINITY_DN2509_c1_g2_i1.p1 TRINITY_DN2509_c1_g2~~TRINITY_DN2509_c1_g2_i1.p1  ORF type:complete len:226 (+),score=37.95 TRINITY_DN2509_c1_g2_i1:59-736(+)
MQIVTVCLAAATLAVAVGSSAAFLLQPSQATAPAHGPGSRGFGAEAEDLKGAGAWGLAAAGLALGAHAGLAAAWRARASMRAEAKEAKAAPAAKYVESVSDARLFEQVYMQYTSEYLKGPMYWHEDKMQGNLAEYPGNPLVRNGLPTSNQTGVFKNFSSNELAFLSMLFFGIGLYGNLMFDVYDPQWDKVDAGGYFNASYIVESLLLPVSFLTHIACYIQRKNGK